MLEVPGGGGGGQCTLTVSPVLRGKQLSKVCQDTPSQPRHSTPCPTHKAIYNVYCVHTQECTENVSQIGIFLETF